LGESRAARESVMAEMLVQLHLDKQKRGRGDGQIWRYLEDSVIYEYLPLQITENSKNSHFNKMEVGFFS